LGNRTAVSFYEPLNAIPPTPTINYTYDGDNRLLTATGTTFNYDNNGNLISKTLGGNTTNYAWDYNDRLTQLVSGGNTYSYKYDGLGNRIARIENSVETRYVVDPSGVSTNVLAETNASGNITAYYVYGLGLISKITPSGQAYYYHYDGIGSTIAMSDSSGNIINKYAYDAFGDVLSEHEATPNPFKYVGRFGVMDEGNGLLYMRARYYDPEAGRFINKDPIGFFWGVNMYMYVSNNPTNYIDPNGKMISHKSILKNIAHGPWWMPGTDPSSDLPNLDPDDPKNIAHGPWWMPGTDPSSDLPNLDPNDPKNIACKM
jgi:RHS repeat-associated protein